MDERTNSTLKYSLHAEMGRRNRRIGRRAKRRMRAEFFQSAPLLLLLLATTSECLSEHRLEGRKVGGRGIVGTRRFSTVGQIECKQRARELRADLTLAENNRDRIRFRFVVGLTASKRARREGKTERGRKSQRAEIVQRSRSRAILHSGRGRSLPPSRRGSLLIKYFDLPQPQRHPRT